jgi:predicted nuclease of predicted toxin-antitoxin system
VKILIDMNLSPRWVEALKHQGFAAVHWATVGDPRAPDPMLLPWAKVNGAVLLAHDLDFGAILAATGGAGPSVVQLRAQDLLAEELVSVVVAALRELESHLDAGALVVIDAQSRRVRLLPLCEPA